MRFLRQSTSVDVPIGPFLDATDGATAETALTVTQPDVRLKKNGGAWAQKAAAQTLTHEENGYYEVTLDATDTDTVGLLRVNVSESGALPVWEDFQVIEEAVYDVLFAASAAGYQVPIWSSAGATVNLSATTIKTATDVETDTADIQSRLPAALTAGGNMKADALALSGDTVAADNAEAFFDGTGYAGTNNVIPTVTTVTNNVNAVLANTAHGGAAATLQLNTMNVTATTGDAVTFQGGTVGAGLACLGTGTVGGYFLGAGANAGLELIGGTGGHGLTLTRGGSGGDDLFLSASDAPTLAAAVWAGATRTLTTLDEDSTTLDLDATIRAAVGLASANLDTQLADLPTNAELSTALGTADDAVLAAIAALNNVSNASVATAVLTTAMTEAYRSTGGTGTVAQLLYEILGNLVEFANSGTTRTVKKLDGTTTAKTYTYDDATTPTSITETT